MLSFFYEMEKKQWDLYAVDYHKYVISPLKRGVMNPLHEDIRKLGDTRMMSVADCGTGRGDLVPFLAKRFKEVYAIDFSPKMLAIARRRQSRHRNAVFMRFDLRRLSQLKKRFDVIIAVNSILMPNREDVERCFAEMYSSLADGGRFYGIFPSMESLLYHFSLVYEREYARTSDEKRALRATRRIVERKKYSLILGIYEDDGERQRLYYEFDIIRRMRTAGFRQIRLSKVFYPWGERSGDFEAFEDRDLMWDWYVSATK
jgi:SAM-dependent methyltransferase